MALQVLHTSALGGPQQRPLRGGPRCTKQSKISLSANPQSKRICGSPSLQIRFRSGCTVRCACAVKPKRFYFTMNAISRNSASAPASIRPCSDRNCCAPAITPRRRTYDPVRGVRSRDENEARHPAAILQLPTCAREFKLNRPNTFSGHGATMSRTPPPQIDLIVSSTGNLCQPAAPIHTAKNEDCWNRRFCSYVLSLDGGQYIRTTLPAVDPVATISPLAPCNPDVGTSDEHLKLWVGITARLWVRFNDLVGVVNKSDRRIVAKK